jgi:5-formyltetrahydrofolate cyclo-ligase
MAELGSDTPVRRRPGGGPEPVGTPGVRMNDLDLLVVPGLAFDARGGRLGRGGGHYDRLLAARSGQKGHRPVLLGLGFEFQIVERVPTAAHDVRLDIVVTEERVLRAGTV